jgi:hypothetical protein
MTEPESVKLDAETARSIWNAHLEANALIPDAFAAVGGLGAIPDPKLGQAAAAYWGAPNTMHGYAGYQEAERLREAYLETPRANSPSPLCAEDDNWNWWLGLAPEVRRKAVSEFRAKFEANAQPVEHTEADRIMALVRSAARG